MGLPIYTQEVGWMGHKKIGLFHYIGDQAWVASSYLHQPMDQHCCCKIYHLAQAIGVAETSYLEQNRDI